MCSVAFFPNTDPYKALAWVNPYKELGKQFQAFSIISVIYTLSVVGDTFRNTYVAIFMGILIFGCQVLIGGTARKAAREFNQPALKQFGTIMILSFVLYLASISINIIPPIYVLITTSATGSFYITFYSLSSAIVETCSIGLQLKAWFSMASFFQATTFDGIQARGTRWIEFVVLTIIIELGIIFMLDIPLAIMKSAIDLHTGSILVPNSAILFQDIKAASMIAWGILTLIGYVKIGGLFLALEKSMMPEQETLHV